MSIVSVPVPSTIYHLARKEDWDQAVAEGNRDYFTESLATEGFTHATGTTTFLLPIANTFYTSAPGDFVLLVIDSSKLHSEIKMERADAPLPGHDALGPPTCPHIFGKIEAAAVVKVLSVKRDAGTGAFLSVEGLEL